MQTDALPPLPHPPPPVNFVSGSELFVVVSTLTVVSSSPASDGRDTVESGWRWSPWAHTHTHTRQLTHTPPGLTAYWTPSPSPSLVTVQYAVSDAMRPLAASSSRGLSRDASPPRYPSPLPHVFVMLLICCLCVEVFFANPYTVPPLEEHSLGIHFFFPRYPLV